MSGLNYVWNVYGEVLTPGPRNVAVFGDRHKEKFKTK